MYSFPLIPLSIEEEHQRLLAQIRESHGEGRNGPRRTIPHLTSEHRFERTTRREIHHHTERAGARLAAAGGER